MKTSQKLSVTDLDERVGPELRALFDKAASSARERLGGPRTRSGKPMLVLHNWRQVASRYLRRHARKINPNIWIYRGGRHIAVHVSRPEQKDTNGYPIRTALSATHWGDPCLCRIFEA